MKKSIFKNTIYKSLLSFVNIVIPLLIGPYIVKLLNVELYGVYNKVYANFQLFLTFASFGIYTFGVREISKIRNDKDKVAQLLSSLFLLSIITNVIVGIIYVIFALCTSNGITTVIYLLMLIQIVSNIFYIEFVNEAIENYKFITIKTLIIKVIYMVSLFVFVRKSTDIIIYSIIVGLTVFINNIVSFVYAKRKIKLNFKKIAIKKYLPSLFMILVITNVDLLYSQLDRVMLGSYVSDVAVTFYYIPYYIVSTLASIPYSIINVSIPRLSYLIENEGNESYERVLNKSVSSLVFIIIPMCMGVFVLASEIMFLYAGKKYMSAVPVLAIAALIRIIISVESTMTNLVMYPNNQEKKIVKYTLIFGILNLILNFILVYTKTLSPLTAMITTGIAEIGLSTSMFIYIRKKLCINYNIFKKSNVIYLLLAIMFIPISIVVHVLNFDFYIKIVLTVLLCVLVYCGVLLLIKDENIFMILGKLKLKVGSKK